MQLHVQDLSNQLTHS